MAADIHVLSSHFAILQFFFPVIEGSNNYGFIFIDFS